MAIEHIDGVARRVDLVRREMELEAADAGERARRGANFGREIGESGEIVAVKGDGVGELAAGDLHAVAGVAGEANDGAVYNLALFRQRNVGGRGHALLQISQVEARSLTTPRESGRRPSGWNRKQVGAEADRQTPRQK